MSGTKRVIGLVAAAVGVVAFGLGLKATGHEAKDQVSTALAKAELNESSADSAPQQQVVNGWVARDLLVVQARQFDDVIKGQQRTNLLLGLLAGLGGLMAVAIALGAAPGSRPSPDASGLQPSPTTSSTSPATPNSDVAG